jgi:hypothetical protein
MVMGKRLLHLADVFWVQFSSSITGWLHHGQKANITARALALSLSLSHSKKSYTQAMSLSFSLAHCGCTKRFSLLFANTANGRVLTKKCMKINPAAASGQLAFAVCPFKLLSGLFLRTSRRVTCNRENSLHRICDFWRVSTIRSSRTENLHH